MYLNNADTIIRKADRTVRLADSRDPERIADALGIVIMDTPFRRQKGVYKVIERNRYIFVKADLDPVMRGIVLLHEIGHDQLHRSEAEQFQEFSLFDMTGSKMEYEANLFAAHIALPDEDVLECISRGYDASQIAMALHSDINLVALKVSDLCRRGYPFRAPEHRNDFLR